MKNGKILIRPIRSEIEQIHHKIIIDGPMEIVDIKMLLFSFQTQKKKRNFA